MTTLQLTLPDDLASRVQQSGVLESAELVRLIEQMTAKAEQKNLEKPAQIPVTQNTESKEITFQPNKQYSVAEVAGNLQHATTKTATVEQMNNSIAEHFKHWEG